MCAIALGDDRRALRCDLLERFPCAEYAPKDRALQKLIADVTACVRNPFMSPTLSLDLGGTVFQQKVWQALCKIPVGQTATYAHIARRIGRPRAVRAVAQACAANPVAVVVPCHRVVRSDGSLSGYRWGVQRKALLLQRERSL